MDTRKATAIIVRYRKTKGEMTFYVTEEYRVGYKTKVPGYKELELVEEIRVVDSWHPHVEVELENYGTIWLNDYVVEIYFEEESYKKVVNARKAARQEANNVTK